MTSLDQLCINSLRFLAVDQVEQARSGHPGLPLGAAPMAYVVWDRFMRHNPANPNWFDRDRFILSAGHGSALLYALLHAYGYEDVTMEQLKRFRQWESKTPGHPEYGMTAGVEATTGPLGQGFSMGVGMAMAESFLAARFNPPNREAPPAVDHYTYAIVSDGDLMEGVASEAASLAGHLKLGKIVYLYDDNRITIDGSTELSFGEDVTRRFEAYGWHVQMVEDGNDIERIAEAIEVARDERLRPSLVRVRTSIGYGSPKQDNASAHGEPLGEDAAAATRDKLDWPHAPFTIPEEAKAHFAEAADRGQQMEDIWEDQFASYRHRYPERAVLLERVIRGQLPDDRYADIPAFEPGDKKVATRAASGKVLNALAGRLPTLIGGSADLSPSNKTLLDDEAAFSGASRGGRNVHFGVREHAMGAIVNGMALHGGLRPYGATFLVFSDYMRPAIRLAALMQVPSIFVFTHDSVGLGEDGPTHQPVEHLASLRAIPGLVVIRPADANETAAAWRVAVDAAGPVALVLSRQGLPVLDPARHAIGQGVAKGAYTLVDADGGKPDIVIIATGSEVSLALASSEALRTRGMAARVVSMPSWELFDRQSGAYRDSILPDGVPRLSIEAGSSLGWWRYVRDPGDVISIDHFGASAPGGEVMDKLGFSVAHVVERALQLMDRQG